MSILHLYRIPGLPRGSQATKLQELQELTPFISGLETEICYNVEVSGTISEEVKSKLNWLFSSPFFPNDISQEPFLVGAKGKLLIEIGPRYDSFFQYN